MRTQKTGDHERISTSAYHVGLPAFVIVVSSQTYPKVEIGLRIFLCVAD